MRISNDNMRGSKTTSFITGALDEQASSVQVDSP